MEIGGTSRVMKTQESEQSRSLSHSKVRQNYVPFISKCPRFTGKPKENLPSLPQISLHVRTGQHEDNKSMKKDNKLVIRPQHFFSSQIDRFAQDKFMTPSPGSYIINEITKPKTHSPQPVQSKVPLRLLPELKTIPSIPDFRNKFGYNCAAEKISFVKKTPEQLEREKNLMRQYQQSLIEEKICISRQQSTQTTPKIKGNELAKKVENIIVKEEKSLQKDGIAKSEAKLKLGHLYEWRPQHSPKQYPLPPPLPISSTDNLRSQSKKTKFQFFNSSQKRFKTEQSAQMQASQKPTIRLYIEKMLTEIK